jgi:hypothetical protein
VAGAVWRTRSRHRRREEACVALLDADPVVRAAGLRAIAAVGLRPWAGWLLARTVQLDATGDDAIEPERVMAAELAWLVSACQWEPADAAEVVQLRLWAKAYHHRYEPRQAPLTASTDPPAEMPPPRPPPTPAAPPPAGPGFDEQLASVLGERVIDVCFLPSGSSDPVEEPGTRT